MGYNRAGFEVVGVDIKPQKHYPFEFHQVDALEYLTEHGREFDFIHASPPCQAYSSLRFLNPEKKPECFIERIREKLKRWGGLWVIENVMGAPLIDPVMLCGTMFKLRTKNSRAELWRHRLFEINWNRPLIPPCNHRTLPSIIGVYGGHGRDRRRVISVIGHSGGFSNRDGTQKYSTEERREAMGIDWMNGMELSQAIPPAYTEYLGKQIVQ